MIFIEFTTRSSRFPWRYSDVQTGSDICGQKPQSIISKSDTDLRSLLKNHALSRVMVIKTSHCQEKSKQNTSP